MEVRTLFRSHTLSEKSIVLDNTTQWSGSRAQIFPATFSITALVRSHSLQLGQKFKELIF
ncbi:MAG: hypothetical protein P2A85_16270 [Microcoleus anatoxicus]|uniref:hypothetical protein n=1 Tax=Microcoleus anatoxicus TaxID=2705319 RepID=UPI0036735FD3